MNFIEVENQYYILASSAFSDQRTMVLKEGDSFGIFDRQGDIHQAISGSHGLFHLGTRYLSLLELNINGQRPMLLSSSPREDNQLLTVDLTNPDLPLENEEVVLRGTVHILRSKFLWQSVYHEKVKISNFGLERVAFTLEIHMDADYADIFEVRGMVRKQKGKKIIPEKNGNHLQFGYKGLDEVVRKTKVSFSPKPAGITHNTAVFEISLDAQEEKEVEIKILFIEGDNVPPSHNFDHARNAMNASMERVRKFCADIHTSSQPFNRWVERSRADLITMSTRTPYGLYPYAGVPWYSTPFGRDGIITALQSLWVEPELARGVLHYLAHTQARDFNDFQDAEPGKIFHETRGGEMAALNEVPFRLYYGTIDATPLFVCLAGAYLERTNDINTIREIWPNIEKALYWIDHYGDTDGDGFVEYKTKSSKGLINQGWKDSHDAIFYEDGRMAEDPIALCEVQGYVYEARIRASAMARVLGLTERAVQLKEEAENLKEKFNTAFWSEDKQIYVLALDGQKKPCDVVSSNAGHCLFSGIATTERARLVARSLLNDSMFTGWGIRTIASTASRYNPMSYHNGSVWPHDNSLIAYGFARYGLMNEVIQVLSATFDTATAMEAQRLPELFCGFDRKKGQPPTGYPVACSPQAWSVAAVFLMIQACLGMHIQADKNTITFNYPVLPGNVKELTITNLRLNNKQLALQVRKVEEGIEVIPLTPAGDLKIEILKKGAITYA